MTTDFEPRDLGDVLNSPEVQAALYAQAEPILARAEAEALHHYRTGRYQSSFEIDRARWRGRVYLRVGNTDPIANILEARYHILGRAVG